MTVSASDTTAVRGRSLRPLTPLEGRVLGVLVEKQHTVPDSYPLSLNALVLGCNQKSARDPVMDASDADVLGAVDGLKSLSLVVEVSGSRVTRYEHNMARVLGLRGQAVAILTQLLLRGPQTAAELRASTERIHRFADTPSVEGFLEELSERTPEQGGPLALRLARAAGAREPRWAQLLGGPVEAGVELASPERPGPRGGDRVPNAELEALLDEVAQLRALVEHLYGTLGVPKPDRN